MAEQQDDHKGNSVDTHRSESNSTTRMEWQEDRAVGTGQAIGVKQTVEVV